MAASPFRPKRKEDDQRQAAAAGGSELEELLGRKLEGLDLLAVFISGIEVARHRIVVGFGIDARGRQRPLGVWEGSTSDRTVCRALVANLVNRGLDPNIRRLFVTDGGAAITAAVRAVFGRGSPIQCCRIHKRQEILNHLPQSEHIRVGRMLDEAWSEIDANRAEAKFRSIADDLETADLGGARSEFEKVEESLTVARLGLPLSLQDSLSATADAEWALSSASAAFDASKWPTGTPILEKVAATLRRSEEPSRPVSGYCDLHWLARALDPVREPRLARPPRQMHPAQLPVTSNARATLDSVPSPGRLPFLITAADVAALITTAALLVTVAFGVQGVVRELLALAFVTLVPGWAVVGRLSLEGDIRRVALAVPVSLALCAAGATAMLWLHAWQPVAMLAGLALGSIALISWTLTTFLRKAMAISLWPARDLLQTALERSARETRWRGRFLSYRSLLKGADAGWLRSGHARLVRRPPTQSLTSLGSVAGPAPARIAGRVRAATRVPPPSLWLKVCLAVVGIQVFWLVPAMSLVVLFAVQPLTGAVSLVVGMLAGILLGASRRVVVMAAAMLVGFVAGLLAIGWQLLLSIDFSSASQAVFEVSLDFWAPGMLGAAIGLFLVPMAMHLERQFALDHVVRPSPRVADPLRRPDDRESGEEPPSGSRGVLSKQGAVPHGRRQSPSRSSDIEAGEERDAAPEK